MTWWTIRQVIGIGPGSLVLTGHGGLLLRRDSDLAETGSLRDGMMISDSLAAPYGCNARFHVTRGSVSKLHAHKTFFKEDNSIQNYGSL